MPIIRRTKIAIRPLPHHLSQSLSVVIQQDVFKLPKLPKHRRTTITAIVPRLLRLLISLLLSLSTLCSIGEISQAYSRPMPPLPPDINPRLVVRPDPIGPFGPTKPVSLCYASGAPKENIAKFTTNAQMLLQYEKAWLYGKGAGQRIAIIDTGVAPHHRLKHLYGGGDYVTMPGRNRVDQWRGITSPQRLNGLWDCDAHGTAIAGIIAAQPSETDALVGVAPDATIISIRQFSATFSRPDKAKLPENIMGTDPQRTYGPSITLAQSIVEAVRFHASIILIPTPECFPVQELASLRDQKYIGAAVYYAYRKNVLIIAGSGNIASNSKYCKTNNYSSALTYRTIDKQSWNNLHTIASPNYFFNYVLTVAATSTDNNSFARPLPSDLHGPWVGVAAPGDHIISLSNSGQGLAAARGARNGKMTQYAGSDFAAAYVAGVAALLRQHYPHATPREIMLRLMLTAHHPATNGEGRNNAIGYGSIDPLAALTDDINMHIHVTDPNQDHFAKERPYIDKPNYFVLYLSILICAILVALTVMIFFFSAPLRARMRTERPVTHEEFSPTIIELDEGPVIETPPPAEPISPLETYS